MTTYDSTIRSINSGCLSAAMLLLPAKMDSLAARAQLLKTTLQESRGLYRKQQGGGPARGLWQFELGTRESRGGVWGVFLHPATRDHLKALCEARNVEFLPQNIYNTLPEDDVLAAGLARLNYWWVAGPLPAINDAKASWDYYLSTWRPGQPHPETWPAFSEAVVRCLTT